MKQRKKEKSKSEKCSLMMMRINKNGIGRGSDRKWHRIKLDEGGRRK